MTDAAKPNLRGRKCRFRCWWSYRRPLMPGAIRIVWDGHYWESGGEFMRCKDCGVRDDA